MDCGDLIAICRVSPGGVLWVPMTSPSSMLVPDHCVCKGQHSTFDDPWTRSYLPGAWEKFAGNVTISIINLSHMCAYSAILRLKIINNKSIEAIELNKIPRDIWARVALSEIIPRTDFRRGDVVQRSPISRSYLGYWACRRCSNYIFILDLTSGFKGFGKDSRKTARGSFKCWDLVRLILETWR